jgi:hypothetical protein
MTDLYFFGGSIGFVMGNQQFTMRNLQFVSMPTAIQCLWNWGFTFQDFLFDSIGIAIDARLGPNSGPDTQPFGSLSILDTTFQSVNVGVFLPGGSSNAGAQSTQLLLDNVDVVNPPGTMTLVGDAGGSQLLEVSSDQTIVSWGRGTAFLTRTDTDGGTSATAQNLPAPAKPASLRAGSGKFYTQSKPQFESSLASEFKSVKDFGAVGDGTTDDTSALNQALLACSQQSLICYFPMGIYAVTSTVLFPSPLVVTGIAYPQIMGMGPFFQDETNPQPVVRVGSEPGQKGFMQMLDLILTVQGPAPGAVILEWNLAAEGQGNAAMWDTHIRIGGTAGSNLLGCAKLTGSVNPACKAASLGMHITPGSNGYFENNWIWTSDHNMETPPQPQLDVYAARGLLAESTNGPIWMYAPSVEHFTLYQYQFYNVSNAVLGFMQTETPYYQPSPAAPEPWSDSVALGLFASDPDFSTCGADTNCAKAWALRIINSSDIMIYGAGFYSFFQNYDQACVNDGSETCQTAFIDINYSDRLWMYDLVSLGGQQAVSPEGGVAITQKQTQFYFVTTIIAYLALSDADAGSQGIPPGSGETFPGDALPPLTSIVYENVTYTLPPAGTVEFPQTDGTPITLGPSAITVGGTETATAGPASGTASVTDPLASTLETVTLGGLPTGAASPVVVSIPTVGASAGAVTVTVAGGTTFQVGPVPLPTGAPASPTDGPSALAIYKQLQNDAQTILDGLENFINEGNAYLGGSLGTSDLSSTLDSTLDSLASAVAGFINKASSIDWKALAAELPPGLMKQLNAAFTAAIKVFNWLLQFKEFQILRNQFTLRRNWYLVGFSLGIGALINLKNAFQGFTDTQPEEEVDFPTAWYLMTVTGTTMAQFNALIQQIDGGKGQQIVDTSGKNFMPFQGYVGKMDTTTRKQIRANPIVLAVVPAGPLPGQQYEGLYQLRRSAKTRARSHRDSPDEFDDDASLAGNTRAGNETKMSHSDKSKRQPPIPANQNAYIRPNAGSQLPIISDPVVGRSSTAGRPPYTLDASEGDGALVYAFDGGFDVGLKHAGVVSLEQPTPRPSKAACNSYLPK